MVAYVVQIWRLRYFWSSLVRIDLRNRYRRSVLGMGWSLLHPILMTTVLCAVVLAEMGVPRPQGVILPTGRDIPPVYRWLAQQPPGTVALELPISGNALLQAFQESSRLYFSTYHWQPLVNGYSGLRLAGPRGLRVRRRVG